MIKHKVEGVILKSGAETVSVPVIAEFVYDPADPLAVEIIFDWEDGDGPQVVVWTVSRELLLRGVVSRTPYGGGDVRMRYEGEETNRVIICLRNPSGHADVGLNQEQMVHFLNLTTDVVRFGDECLTGAIDEALKEILGS